MKKMENEQFDYKNFRFEFVLSLNGHIICQRLFDIKGYNEEVLKSMDLKYLVDDCVELIENDLKEKSVEQLWKYFNPYAEQTQEEIDKNKFISEKQRYFDFAIKVDGKPVIEKRFDGHYYSLNAKLQVDIKDIIPVLINEIRSTFSRKKVDKKFAEITLG